MYNSEIVRKKILLSIKYRTVKTGNDGYNSSNESKIPSTDDEVDPRRERPTRDTALQPEENAQPPSQELPDEGRTRAEMAV